MSLSISAPTCQTLAEPTQPPPAIAAAIVQLTGYGTGFLKAYFSKIVLGKGRDINEEIEIRKGKNENL